MKKSTRGKDRVAPILGNKDPRKASVFTPEALRRRLAHGNVYPANRIDAALGNYFRVGNLTALRELALLWVADQVDVALQRYRAEQRCFLREVGQDQVGRIGHSAEQRFLRSPSPICRASREYRSDPAHNDSSRTAR